MECFKLLCIKLVECFNVVYAKLVECFYPFIICHIEDRIVISPVNFYDNKPTIRLNQLTYE